MASRFWVGGSGDWDASTTTHWAATSGGAGGQSVPGASDTVTFDGNSGGGTVTRSVDVSLVSFAFGAFTGTLDFAAHNKNMTLSTNNSAFNGSGTGTRTINLGNGIYTFTNGSTGTPVNMGTTTNLTFNANGSTLVFSGTLASPGTVITFTNTLTWNAIQFGAQPNGGVLRFSAALNAASLSATGPGVIELNTSTLTIGTLTLTGSASGLILVRSGTEGTSRTLSVASNAPTMSYCAFRDMTGAGGASFIANNSFDLGNNSGITINGPSGGGHIATRQQLGM
jgi:hypothetical protein